MLFCEPVITGSNKCLPCQLLEPGLVLLRLTGMACCEGSGANSFLSLFSLPSLVVNSSKCPQKHYFSTLHFRSKRSIFRYLHQSHLNPIEKAGSRLKTGLRATAARTVQALDQAIEHLLPTLTPKTLRLGSESHFSNYTCRRIALAKLCRRSSALARCAYDCADWSGNGQHELGDSTCRP